MNQKSYVLFAAVLALGVHCTHAQKPGVRSVAIQCLDGRSRALGIYVPPQYNAKHPCPLFVWLHGGVNRKEKDRGIGAVKFFADQAKAAGILCAAPSGERGATWFDKVGYNNLAQSLRYMIKNFAVDTSQIYVGGSSDGATACYLLAMNPPGFPVKGFVVCSGYAGVLRQLGIAFDAKQCAPYRWYVIHTGKDHLYPVNLVQQLVKSLKGSGASVVFKQYPGHPHGLDYAEKEKPLILRWIMGREN